MNLFTIYRFTIYYLFFDGVIVFVAVVGFGVLAVGAVVAIVAVAVLAIAVTTVAVTTVTAITTVTIVVAILALGHVDTVDDHAGVGQLLLLGEGVQQAEG